MKIELTTENHAELLEELQTRSPFELWLEKHEALLALLRTAIGLGSLVLSFVIFLKVFNHL